MKKILIYLTITLLLVSSAYANPFMTIGMKSLSFVNPAIGEAINTAMCVYTIASCISGKVTGEITGKFTTEAMKALPPEAVKAITTYNQVRGYVDQGASIVQELKVNNQGDVEEGSMKFTKQAQVGNMVGKNIKKEDITLTNAQIIKKDGVTTIMLDQDGTLQVKGIDKGSNKVVTKSYSNIQKGGIIKLNENGEVIEADITSNEKGGTFSFGKDTTYTDIVKVPPNTKVTYKDGKLMVHGKGTQFEYSQYSGDKNLKNIKIEIIDGDELTIQGNRVRGKHFKGLDFEVKGLEKDGFGEVTFSNEDTPRIIQVGEKTDAVVQGIEHRVFGEDPLSISYDENFNSEGHKGENYFNYGKNKIQLGGSGFTSSLREGNKIFPEYIQNVVDGRFKEREARMEFTPKGGALEIAKVSADNRPLAVNIKGEGNFNIKNGKWVFEAEGDKIYANVERLPQFHLASDMRFVYTTKEGGSAKNREYDFSTGAAVNLGQKEEALVKKDIANLESSRLEAEKKYNTELEQLPLEVRSELIKLDKELEENRKKIEEINTKLKTAKKMNEKLKLEAQLEEQEDSYLSLTSKQEGLLTDKKYKGVYEAKKDIVQIEDRIGYNKHLLKRYVAEDTFSEVVRDNSGNSRLTYSRFIEGFPVRKNSEERRYFILEVESESGEGGSIIKSRRLTKLEKPGIVHANRDILDLPPPEKERACADTQIVLQLQYQKTLYDQGLLDRAEFPTDRGVLTYNFKDNTYTVLDSKTRKLVTRPGGNYNKWITYVEAEVGTGDLRRNLQRVEKVEDIIPGDILTLHPDKGGYGHTQAVKEVLEIPPGSGIKYYKLFAGSDPPQDARIYPNLVSQDEIRAMLGSKAEDVAISRFPEPAKGILVAKTE